MYGLLIDVSWLMVLVVSIEPTHRLLQALWRDLAYGAIDRDLTGSETKVGLLTRADA
jgi:hypothetical protein